MELNGKNILITGASSGIGQAIARHCVACGARVRLAGRNVRELELLASELGECKASIHPMDMRDTDSFPATIDELVAQYGKLSGFVHSAGYQITTPLQRMDIKSYQNIFLVNTFAAFELCRLLSMKKNHKANDLSLVLISSVMSVVALPGLVAYCSTKAALAGGARAMAVELAPKNIRVNCISPGTIKDTAMTIGLETQLSVSELDRIKRGFPLGLGTTQDISSMVVFLLSDAGKWITGQNIVIDGGYSIA